MPLVPCALLSATLRSKRKEFQDSIVRRNPIQWTWKTPHSRKEKVASRSALLIPSCQREPHSLGAASSAMACMIPLGVRWMVGSLRGGLSLIERIDGQTDLSDLFRVRVRRLRNLAVWPCQRNPDLGKKLRPLREVETDIYACAGYAGTLSSLAVRYTAVRRSVPCPWSSATFVHSVLSSAFCLSPRR